MPSSEQKYEFHVSGMHCKSCELLTESELKENPKVISAKSSLKTNSVLVTGHFGEASPEEIARELSSSLLEHGYRLSVEKEAMEKNWSEFKVAVPLALGFAVLFFLLQKAGLVNLIDSESVSYGTAFIIGVIASLSTCMAVVGGLVLSLSATFAKEGDRVKPQALFHIGRLVSFFVLGGAIGALGANFSLSTTASFLLSLIIGLVMLILGLNLLDVFHGLKRFSFTMPKFLSKRAYAVSEMNHSLTPLLVGIATFFLPCGFTQSMQLYTLSTGSFFDGAFTMFAFALGTLPVLALLSFSSFSIQESSKAGIFFKTAGLIVILFALLNLLSSFVIIGVLPPFLNI